MKTLCCKAILSIDAFIVNSEQEMSGFEIHHNEQLLEAKVPGPVGKGLQIGC